MRRSWLASLVWLGMAIATATAAAGGPADGLLRLVPGDSVATLAVEDFRGRAREVIASPLYASLLRLPTVRTWIASGAFTRAERASREVQRALGVSLETIRDEILGDAVVLSFQAGPDGQPDRARGLLLAKPRDRALVDRLMTALNDAQFESGELVGVEPKSRGPARYSARNFRVAKRPAEFYATLDDGSFAWSNSEPMIQSVLDRQGGGGTAGLGGDPGFLKVRAGLPGQALASLFLNPRALEAAMAAGAKEPGDFVGPMLLRYLGAVGQAGLALEWREGIWLHSCETLAVERLDPWLRDWLAKPLPPTSLASQVSSATIAVASIDADARVVAEAIRSLTPPGEQPAWENFRLAVRGMLMGRDPITDVLPRLGPGAVLAVEIEPNRATRPIFPWVGAVGWTVGPGLDDLAGPIDNAVRTFLALYAFQQSRRADHLRVDPGEAGPSRVTSLTDGLRTRVAYRVDRDRLIVGNSADAVARFGTGQAPSRFADLRSRLFPEAGSFAIIDLERLVPEVRFLRGPMARVLAARSKRPVEAADRDLNDLIALAELFQAATFATGAPRDPAEVRRTIGLIAR
jgi:hypothetical protein